AALRLFRTDIAGLKAFVSSGRGRVDAAERGPHHAVLSREGQGTFRGTSVRPDGSTFPQEVDIAQMAIGGEQRWLVLIRDLSAEDRLQQELLQAQKMEAIGQLVSGVAHELNNPLAAIIAFSQLLRHDERLPDDMKHDADLLVQEADRTRRIVQNLLDFARQRPPERHSTAIRALVESVLAFHSYNMAAGRIAVELKIPDDLPPIDLDRAQLQQVLLNLTLNAIQAIQSSQPSGTIQITAEERRREDGTPCVRVSVTDDGPGVPRGIRSRVFLPFFTTKEPGQGTGLGLSVSFGIAAAHGGSLWLDESLDVRGARFVLELPVSAAADAAEDEVRGVAGRTDRTRRSTGATRTDWPATPAAGAPEVDAAPTVTTGTGPITEPSALPIGGSLGLGPGGATGAARPHVLVLDDEPSIRAFLAKALRIGGFEPTVAEAARQALEHCDDEQFDAVLIDHRMPGMSGTEVYAAAVAIQPELRGRVIFMSGDVLNPELRTFARAHGIGLLAKPFDVETVIRAVAEVARRPAS
ncbi:MAG TPA: ATP-binding protein, partial [Candidatus Saccharimonadales bacterium]|nr:ATP-binding protein [Candidatus Saccharimonadales bacterium]